jgi:hypothetical protein
MGIGSPRRNRRLSWHAAPEMASLTPLWMPACRPLLIAALGF